MVNPRSSMGRAIAGLPLAICTVGSLYFVGGFADDRQGLSILMGLCAGLAIWILWPLFARKPGWTGIALDAVLIVAAIALGGAIGGTMLQPGAFTILGAISALLLPLAHFGSAALHVAAAAITIVFARR